MSRERTIREAVLQAAWAFTLSDHLGDAGYAFIELAKALGVDLSEYEDESGEHLCDLDKLRAAGISEGLYDAELGQALSLPAAPAPEPSAVDAAREACANVCRNIASSGVAMSGLGASSVQQQHALDGAHEAGSTLLTAEAEEGGA